MKYFYQIVYIEDNKLKTERISSVALLVTKLTDLNKGPLGATVVALLVNWAKKAVAGESIQVDQYFVVRIIQKEGPH